MGLYSSRVIAITAFAAAAAIATPAIAGQLVVRSSGPSAKQYPPGKQVPDSAKIELRPGDSLTLLAPGSTRTLRGPGTFSAEGGGNVSLAANRRARFGALRSGELNVNPSPWNIDVSKSGTVCVADPSKLKLWRSDSEGAAEANITGSGGSSSVAWEAGSSSAAWPAQLPVENGAEYQIVHSGSGEITTVKLATMQEIPEEMMETAEAMIERGCNAQLEVLVSSIDQ